MTTMLEPINYHTKTNKTNLQGIQFQCLYYTIWAIVPFPAFSNSSFWSFAVCTTNNQIWGWWRPGNKGRIGQWSLK